MALTLAYQLSQRIYSDMSSTFRTSPETTPTNMRPRWSNMNDLIFSDFNLALGWSIRQTAKFNSPPVLWLYVICYCLGFSNTFDFITTFLSIQNLILLKTRHHSCDNLNYMCLNEKNALLIMLQCLPEKLSLFS